MAETRDARLALFFPPHDQGCGDVFSLRFVIHPHLVALCALLGDAPFVKDFFINETNFFRVDSRIALIFLQTCLAFCVAMFSFSQQPLIFSQEPLILIFWKEPRRHV